MSERRVRDQCRAQDRLLAEPFPEGNHPPGKFDRVVSATSEKRDDVLARSKRRAEGGTKFLDLLRSFTRVENFFVPNIAILSQF